MSPSSLRASKEAGIPDTPPPPSPHCWGRMDGARGHRRVRSHSGSIPAPQVALGLTPKAGVPVPVGVHPHAGRAGRDGSSLAPQAVLGKESDTCRSPSPRWPGAQSPQGAVQAGAASVNAKHPEMERGVDSAGSETLTTGCQGLLLGEQRRQRVAFGQRFLLVESEKGRRHLRPLSVWPGAHCTHP